MFGRIIGLGIIGGMAFAGWLWIDVQSKRREIEPERALLAKATSDWNAITSKVNAARSEVAPLEATVSSFDRLTAEKDTSAARILELEAELAALKTQFAEAV